MDNTRVYLTESLSTKEKNENKKQSIISYVLKVMGYLIIIIGLFFCGFIVFFESGFSYLMLGLIFLGSIIIGILIIAFGQAIYILQKINDKLEQIGLGP
ncbi:MAG: hypothetical protein ACOC1O_05385 [bacterium]